MKRCKTNYACELVENNRSTELNQIVGESNMKYSLLIVWHPVILLCYTLPYQNKYAYMHGAFVLQLFVSNFAVYEHPWAVCLCTCSFTSCIPQARAVPAINRSMQENRRRKEQNCKYSTFICNRIVATYSNHTSLQSCMQNRTACVYGEIFGLMENS